MIFRHKLFSIIRKSERGSRNIIQRVLFILIFAYFLSSCKVASFLRPNVILKTPPNYQYANLNDSLAKLDYKIDVADQLHISISPNNGFNRVNFIAENNTQVGRDYIELTVNQEGQVKMPLIGYINVKGKTTKELELEIESLYENYYVKPFVTVRVNNRRIVFLQGAGLSRSLPIQDNNTTLFEAIGMAGGLREDAKSYTIKLIRNYNGITKVYKIDLSTIDKVNQGNVTLLSNDIIYVEPRLRLLQRGLNEITPILSIISTSLLIFNLIKQ
jgi:polysaccharide biosynthesis/export protein